MYLDPDTETKMAKSALYHYLRVLVASAAAGNTGEVKWLLDNVPGDLADLQRETFCAALFAAVVNGRPATCQLLLDWHNPEKVTIRLPLCTEATENAGKYWHPGLVPHGFCDPSEVSFLGLSYGWELAQGFTDWEQEGSYPKGSQYLGLMQLLLNYGVDPTPADVGLLQRLSYTGDMAAISLLESHGLKLATATLADGRTMLHLVISFCPQKCYKHMGGASSSTERAMAQQERASHVEARCKEIRPLVEHLLAAGASCCLRDSSNKTVLDVCLPTFTGLKVMMNNAVLAQGAAATRQAGSQCTVCMERASEMVMVPCGHLCVCQQCFPQLQHTCPVCRGNVTQMIRMYPA